MSHQHDHSGASKQKQTSGHKSSWFKKNPMRLGARNLSKMSIDQVGRMDTTDSDTRSNNDSSMAQQLTAAAAVTTTANCKSQPSAMDRFRRPLFKYKQRHKTVAFDQLDTSMEGETTVTSSNTNADSFSVSCSVTDTDSITSKSINLSSCQSSAAAGGGVPGPAAASNGSPMLPIYSQTQANNANNCYSSTRCSSTRSSSSLSTSDTFYSSSLFIVSQDQDHHRRSVNGGNQQQQQQHSMVDLVRAQQSSADSTSVSVSSQNSSKSCQPQHLGGTSGNHNNYPTTARNCSASPPSGGSRNEMSGAEDMLMMVSLPHTGAELDGRDDGNHHRQLNNKQRYQLVKTVQTTLTNLTKSTNSGAQQAKKSFCNALFKYSTPCEATTVRTNQANLVGASQLAQVEQIGVTGGGVACSLQPMLGYCK